MVSSKSTKVIVKAVKYYYGDISPVQKGEVADSILYLILLHEKLLQFDWLRAVVFQLNLKYLHVKITNPLRVVV